MKKQMVVEIFDVPYGTEGQCSLCGGSVDWVPCENCEDGYSHHDCGEDTCCCLNPENNVPCDVCDGKGGWWECLSGCGTTTKTRRLKQEKRMEKPLLEG